MSSRSKYDKKDAIILIIVTSFAWSTFILYIFYKNNGLLHILYQYIALPVFWVGIIYVSLHSYFIDLTEKNKSSGRLSVLTFLAYVGIVMIIYALAVMALFPHILSVSRLMSSIIRFPVLIYAILAVSYAVSFSLIFAVSAIAEAITYAVIGRVRAPYITHGGNYLAIWLLGYSSYGGMAFGGVYKGFVIIKSMVNDFDDVGRGILVHEVQHVRGRHVPIILGSIFALPIYIFLILASSIKAYYAYLMAPFMVLLPLILFRAFEVNADRAMFNFYGSKALNYIIAVLKSSYGILTTDKAPLGSRVSHPGRRDLVLAFGDAIAPHAPWEFPALLSLLTASVISIAFVSHVTLLVNNAEFITYFTLLTYVTTALGSMVFTILLGLVLRPVARLFLSHVLTNRGLLNISTLTAGLYIAISGFMFYGINTYVLIASFVLIMLLIINYYVKLSTKSLAYLALSLAVLIATSFAIQYVLLFSIHFMRIMPSVNT